MPRGVLGMNASMFKGYLRYIANRRATQIGLEALFPNEENPFPWMSEMIDLKKERNFFGRMYWYCSAAPVILFWRPSARICVKPT